MKSCKDLHRPIHSLKMGTKKELCIWFKLRRNMKLIRKAMSLSIKNSKSKSKFLEPWNHMVVWLSPKFYFIVGVSIQRLLPSETMCSSRVIFARNVFKGKGRTLSGSGQPLDPRVPSYLTLGLCLVIVVMKSWVRRFYQPFPSFNAQTTRSCYNCFNQSWNKLAI